MKAKLFLSKKTIDHLKGIELTTQAEELQCALENLLEDLPHYLLRLDLGGLSNESALIHLGRLAYTAGARYKTPGVSSRFRKTYKDLVTANSFDLGREAACAISPLKATLLNIGSKTLFAEVLSLGTRKLQQKAWVHSTWEGEMCEGTRGMVSAILNAGFKRKKVPVVSLMSKVGPYLQQGSGFFVSTTEKAYHIPGTSMQQSVIYEALHIVSSGIGKMHFNEKYVPVFNLDAPCELYIAAENGKGQKYLVGFPDARVLERAKDLRVTSWTLNRVCTPDNKLRFILTGANEEGHMVIACYGMSPFYAPEIVR